MSRSRPGTSPPVKQLVVSSLFAALMVAGTYIKVPIGPVPIVLTNYFVLLAALLLDRRWAVASVGLYLFLGLIGLPVFAAGAGPAYFVGPTGGYLAGYLPAVVLTSLLSSGRRRSPVRDVLALVTGAGAIYALGVPWLALSTGMSFSRAVVVGVLPFLIGDALKIAAAFFTAYALTSAYPELLPRFEAAPEEDG